jgi:hypothetical protein
MKKEYKKYIPFSITLLLFSGCSMKPNIIYFPKVKKQEVAKYEQKYLAEYKKIQQKTNKNDNIVKWIQAANKKSLVNYM